MNAKILCHGLTKESIDEALVLGEYKKGDLNIQGIKYKLYQCGDRVLILFEDEFDFCQMSFVVIDLLDATRNTDADVTGYVDTVETNKITEFLKGERTCLYLSDPIRAALEEDESQYLDMVDIVTVSNQHYSTDIDTFFSYPSDEQMVYEEPTLVDANFELIEEGEYLYEKGDFESEYLDDLESLKELEAQGSSED